MSNKVYVVGVGMTHFDKPGRRKDVDYPDYALEATTKALLDANITFDDVQFAAVGYVYGDSTSGQRALYQLGLTQIPIINVNNNCSTGSTAYYLAKQSVASGQYECALALGFEKMAPGSLASVWEDRTNPMDKTIEVMNELREMTPAPFAAQIFSNAGLEYIEKFKKSDLAMHLIAEKNHNHSTLNPYSQFKDKYTLEQVQKARKIHGSLTLLHCSPTSDGAACAIIASEDFVIKHNLGPQAVEIVGQSMATDSILAFDPTGNSKSMIEVAGSDMTRRAAADVYRQAKINPKEDVDVVELHDCFSANELITYDALGLCEHGKACEFMESGATTSPLFDRPSVKANPPKKRIIVNPSGGLISKGHPLGATGLAQCAELTWQLRGWAGARQVPNIKNALQHNIGLGGAVVVTCSRNPEPNSKILSSHNIKRWEDPRKRFGYNPAVEARPVTESQVRAVMSYRGGLSGTKEKLDDKYAEHVGTTIVSGNTARL
ncbi:hypothetical protein HDU92_006105 [Lobulomyces angularis]|nr:hypothetical protein HDU92_006105 [Lobulomyces angularis]